MKRLLFPVTAALCVFSLGACNPKQEPKPKNPGGFHKPQQPANPNEDPNEDPPEKPEKPGPSEPTHPGSETPPAPTAPPQTKNYEYGKPVPGKPGFVTSPYAPAAGYVDVRGFGPATEVKDPYTGKIFLVP